MDDKKTNDATIERMPVAKENIRINVTFSRKENELLKKVADIDGRSVSNLIRFIAVQYAKQKQPDFK